RQRRATRHAQHLAVAAGNLHAAQRRGRHVVELLSALLLALAPASWTAALAAERTGRRGTASTTATAAGTATACRTTAARTPWRAGTAATTRPTRTTGTVATAAGTTARST